MNRLASIASRPFSALRRRVRSSPAAAADPDVAGVFEVPFDLMGVASLDGTMLRVNPGIERVLGIAPEEIVGRKMLDFVHPDDAEATAAAFGSVLESGELSGFENRMPAADGSYRWLQWNVQANLEEGVLYGLARDVTERHRAEEELRQTQRELEVSRDESRALADEQAALRRVATLVAHERPPDEVFAAVAREVGEVLGVAATHLGRFEGTDTVVSVGQWGAMSVPIGAKYPLDGDSVSARVLRSGQPTRMDGYEDAAGVIAATVRDIGIRFSIGVPISVAGRPWGVMIASSNGDAPFPAATEARLRNFTDLVATAVSNASAHAELRGLADEQAALRRVATLIARQAPQAEVFAAIAEGVGRLLGVDSIEMVRYEEDRFGAIVASAGPIADVIPIGTRAPLGGRNIASLVFRTGAAARIDEYEQQADGPFAELMLRAGARSVVGTPIMVEGRLWGAMLAVTHAAPLAADTEARMTQFTELMATAIANAETRAEVTRLADEQAALRRVATLVAAGPRPSAVFDAVTAEVADLMDASAIALARYDGDALTVVARRGAPYVQVGQRYPLGGENVTSTVFRTGRTARFDDYSDATGAVVEVAHRVGVRSTVAAPVVVEGRTWGVLVAIWSDSGPPPEDTERRMASFAELLDTAVANADSRDQLTASRARVLAAGDDARRRVVRDLHDGAQQRLVHTVVTLKLAQRAFAEQPDEAESLVAEALGNAEHATAELRELAHGILPGVLTGGGLRVAIDAFVSRLDLLVDVDVANERLPPDIEASAYFFVAEALTNVVKHAQATRATVTAAVADGVLALEVRDDGVGGANPGGHGLLGLADRVEASGGRLRIDSPPDSGTLVAAELPLPSRDL